MFDGYWKLPDKTRDAFRGDYCTVGDLARRDEDGYIHLVDRKSNMIISGGENIYPSEVEPVLGGHPKVEDVAVSVSRMKMGRGVHAVIVLHHDESLIAGRNPRLVQDRIAGYKRPKSISFVAENEMPRTATGKFCTASCVRNIRAVAGQRRDHEGLLEAQASIERGREPEQAAALDQVDLVEHQNLRRPQVGQRRQDGVVLLVDALRTSMSRRPRRRPRPAPGRPSPWRGRAGASAGRCRACRRTRSGRRPLSRCRAPGRASSAPSGRRSRPWADERVQSASTCRRSARRSARRSRSACRLGLRPGPVRHPGSFHTPSRRSRFRAASCSAARFERPLARRAFDPRRSAPRRGTRAHGPGPGARPRRRSAPAAPPCAHSCRAVFGRRDGPAAACSRSREGARDSALAAS